MRTPFPRLILAAAGGLGLAAAAPGQAPPAGVADPAAARPVAYIHGNVPVTRQDLGEFLIARGGYEKLELLVNKKIIEFECQKQGVTVTEAEMMAALAEDVAGLSIKKEDFIKVVLPRYGKTYYEWMEDVVKPRLLLTKLCRQNVTVSEADLKKQFDREYGERRKVQIIIWPETDDMKGIQEQWGKLRTDQAEFDRVARSQANVALAAATGHIKPISRHLPAADHIVEKTAFEMKPGEVSGILKTFNQGYMVMKLHAVIPPEKVEFESVKPRLEKQAFDERIAEEIPNYFAGLKKAAGVKDVAELMPAQWRTVQPAIRPDGDTMQGIVPAGK
jgi:hypothetical protein